MEVAKNEEGNVQRRECLTCDNDISHRTKAARYCEGCAEANKKERNSQWAKSKRRGVPLQRQYPFCVDCGCDMTGYGVQNVFCKRCAGLRKTGAQDKPYDALRRHQRDQVIFVPDTAAWATSYGVLMGNRHPSAERAEDAMISMTKGVVNIRKEIVYLKNTRKGLGVDGINLDIKALESIMMDMEEEAEAIKRDMEEEEALRFGESL